MKCKTNFIWNLHDHSKLQILDIELFLKGPKEYYITERTKIPPME